MFGEPQHVQIRIVIEERHLPPPADPHRVPGIEDKADCGFEALGPNCWWSERMRGPVELANARSHFPATLEKIEAAGILTVFILLGQRW
jgi:hypothetical protein